MILLWSKAINSHNPWEPNYNGCFYATTDDVLFLYEDWNDLCALPRSKDTADVIYSSSSESCLELPYSWIMVDEADTSYLFFAQDRAIDLSIMTVTNDLPNPVLSKYRAKIKPQAYYEESPFYFGEYCISHKGMSGYICTKNGNPIWEFKGQAYLYTDIQRWNNCVYFGTAGKGGYVYILDIDTGEALAKIKTGGTSSIVRFKNLCYFLGNNKKATLFCVDLTNGNIVQEIALPGKATTYSRVQLIDNHIHVITFEYKGNTLKNAVWSCIVLE